jgi:phenylacetate-CoA ligase
MLEDVLRGSRRLYYDLPGWAGTFIGRTYACIPARVRLGRTYRSFQALLKESATWDKAQLEAYQLQQLQDTVSHAYEHVPYYRRRFDEHGVMPGDLRSLPDIRRFPTLSKKDIQEHLDELVADDVPAWKRLLTTTGGSTAEPLRFYQVKGVTRSKERAFIEDGWSRAGYRPRARCVQLKGRAVGNPETGCTWEYEPIQNYLEMDSNYLTEESIPRYLEAMRAFEPEFLIGFVSSIYLVAKYLQRHPDEAVPAFKTVYLASENVHDWQRAVLEDVFKCRIFSHYGHSEMALLGMECEHGHQLHFYPEYGYLELLDEHDEEVNDAGGRGELLGTTFHNPAMPLIRYRTQDFGVRGEAACACGRVYPILATVEGRLQEFIVTADQRLISICTMGAAHFDIADDVSETQYYQDTPGKLVFRVVPRAGYTQEVRERIRDALESKMDGAVSVHVEEVERIERSRTGKHVMMEQRIPVDRLSGIRTEQA